MGSVVVMGRNTFLSIGGIPLDGRINCVISGRGVLATGVEKFTSLEEVMKKYDDFWIIGGAELYNCALERELVDYALITRIRQGYGADTFFSKSALERFSSRVLYENSEYSIVEYL
jgi:dihydrofolate reductase